MRSLFLYQLRVLIRSLKVAKKTIKLHKKRHPLNAHHLLQKCVTQERSKKAKQKALRRDAKISLKSVDY